MLPKYAIDTWVCSKSHPHIKMKIDSVYWSHTTYQPAYKNNKATVIYEKDIELWTPKEGEWCWFSDEEQPYDCLLAEFGEFHEAEDEPYMTKNGMTYRYCEPFIHDLPSNLISYDEFTGEEARYGVGIDYGKYITSEPTNDEIEYRPAQIDFAAIHRILTTGDNTNDN